MHTQYLESAENFCFRAQGSARPQPLDPASLRDLPGVRSAEIPSDLYVVSKMKLQVSPQIWGHFDLSLWVKGRKTQLHAKYFRNFICCSWHMCRFWKVRTFEKASHFGSWDCSKTCKAGSERELRPSQSRSGTTSRKKNTFDGLESALDPEVRFGEGGLNTDWNLTGLISEVKTKPRTIKETPSKMLSSGMTKTRDVFENATVLFFQTQTRRMRTRGPASRPPPQRRRGAAPRR